MLFTAVRAGLVTELYLGTEVTRPHHLISNFRREPLSLINLRKRNVESGEEELASRLDHYKAKATRHIFLIRHSQYHMDGALEEDCTLTPLGTCQCLAPHPPPPIGLTGAWPLGSL